MFNRMTSMVFSTVVCNMVSCVLIKRFVLFVAGVATRRDEMSNYLGGNDTFERVRNTMISSPGAPHGTEDSWDTLLGVR